MPGGSDDPIIVKGAASENDDSSDDPIIVKGGGPGSSVSVNVLLSSPASMGWTITPVGDVTTITIPATAKWRVKIDSVSGKVYLERPNNVITRMIVDDMVDTANPTVDVPPSQKPKAGNDPEIEIYFAPI
jgi:hypothetical protein